MPVRAYLACLCPPPCSAVGSAAPPSPARLSSTRRFCCLGGGRVSVPSLPLSVAPRNSISLGGHFGGSSSTPWLSMPLGESTPPTTPWRPPPEVSTTPEALGYPSLLPTPEDSPTGFPCLPATLSLNLCLSLWQTIAPASSTSLEVTYQVSPLPAAVPPWCCFCAASFRFPRCCRHCLDDLPRPPLWSWPPPTLPNPPSPLHSTWRFCL